MPNLTRSVSIEGPGAGSMTVLGSWAGGEDRVFTLASGVTASVSGLTISNGGNGGGGIYNSGTLTINNTTISGNTVTGGIANLGILTVNNSTISGNYWGGDNVRGAGIANWGTLTVNNSTISGNWVNGGAAAGGGGIWSGGTLTVNNSTISGNRVTGVVLSGAAVGGGIWSTAGTVTVSNSTIAGNSATDSPGSKGGGILAIGAIATRNTIVAGNTAPAGPDIFGNLGSQGYNLLGNPQDASGWVETDIVHVNPRLGPLQDNGGATLTHALLPGSPAIDAGNNADAPEFDQRGLPRVTGNVLDIGAYEVQPGPVAAFSLVAPESALAGVPFDLSLIAYDADGYLATNYSGMVAFFSSTDPDAGLPKPYTFTEADAGVVYLPESAVLFAEGVQEVGVYDVETFAEGFAYVEVFPGSAPGGASPPPWAYWSDAATLLAMLSQHPRVRP